MHEETTIVAALLAGLGATACVDVQNDLTDFTKRYEKIPHDAAVIGFDAGGDATGCVRTEGNVKPYYITISPIIAPDKPSVLHADIEIVQGGDAMVLTVQPYAAADRVTLVGMKDSTMPIPIAPDGTFKSEPEVLDVPPEANAILVGQPAKTEVSLEGGRVCDDTEFACGVVFGRTIEPIPDLSLDNSTWTAQLITDEANLPAPLKNCKRDPIPPL